jgi:hypothetical protein
LARFELAVLAELPPFQPPQFSKTRRSLKENKKKKKKKRRSPSKDKPKQLIQNTVVLRGNKKELSIILETISEGDGTQHNSLQDCNFQKRERIEREGLARFELAAVTEAPPPPPP